MIIYPQKPIKLSEGKYKYFRYGNIKTIELGSTSIDGVYYSAVLCQYFYDFKYSDCVLLSNVSFNLHQYIFDTIVI